MKKPCTKGWLSLSRGVDEEYEDMGKCLEKNYDINKASSSLAARLRK